MAAGPAGPTYTPRRPEETALWRTVQTQLPGLDNIQFTRDITPECLPQNQAWDACQATAAPGLANWTCSPVPGFMPGAPACDALLEELFACEGF